MTRAPFARFDMPSQREMFPFADGPEPRQRCPQIWFDPILRRFAQSRPTVAVRFETKLSAFEQDAKGVTAELVNTRTGRRETVTADFLAACDGASSPIRQSLGIGLDGLRLLSHNINVFFRAAELYVLEMRENGLMNVLFDGQGQWGVNVAVDGTSTWRLSVYSEERIDPATVDVLTIIRRLSGRDIDHEVLNLNCWTRRHAVAERYRAGRVFLIGDSAHQLTPNGGFGMNTGIGDAVDFCWKLEAVRTGWGRPGLLDSYEIERKPIAERNVRESTRNFDQLMRIPHGLAFADDTKEGESLREQARDFIYANRLERATQTSGVALGYRYDLSPIVVPDGTAAPPDDPSNYVPNARPGSRAPHAWLSEGRSILDLFGNGFVLLDFGASDYARTPIEIAAQTRGVPLRTIRVEDEAARELYCRRLILVRPDGHVAWRGDEAPPDATGIIDCIIGSPP